MNRRGFLGVLLGAAVAPKTMLAPKTPVVLYADTDSVFFSGLIPQTMFFGGRVEWPSAATQTIFRSERVVMKLYSNSLYGKFAA